MNNKTAENRKKLRRMAYTQKVEAWLAAEPPRRRFIKWRAWLAARPKWEG